MNKQSLLLTLTILSTTTVFGAELNLAKRVIEHACPNGLHLLVLERHFSPRASIRMMFRTGSVEETGNLTGLAHMFEHMMFKGTRTLGTKNYAQEAPLLGRIDSLHRALDAEKARGEKSDQARIAQLIEALEAAQKQESGLAIPNELWDLYEREGASDLNAGTAPDFTEYAVDLPSNKIELWAILDSDRLKNPVFRQFYEEREVVKEERRMRVDTNPEGKLNEDLLAAAFTQHPYRHPTIGWESDLNHLTVADLENFYRRYYTPNRLTIAIVGDVKAPEVIALVDRHFGNWKMPAAPPEYPIASETPQHGQRRITVNTDAQPRLTLGFHIPNYRDPDYPTYSAIADLLCAGRTSRLYKYLVEQRRLAASVACSEDFPGERYGHLFIISATPRFPNTTMDVEHAIGKQLDALKQRPIEAWELDKVRSRVDVELLNALQTNSGMASTLAYDQSIFGDWRYLPRFQKSIEALTSKDILRVIQKTFNPENETMAVLASTKKSEPPSFRHQDPVHAGR